VGKAAAFLEMSVIFALFFGWFFRGERLNSQKIFFIIETVLWVYLVKFGNRI
tara:strand:+ start:273 stop:428 length:156 start_codon:yes stop_codon:yes gene_type:complete